jgi:hypothetical protein
MRDLTLHEKISIKGLLAARGWRPLTFPLAQVDMKHALYCFPRFTGKSIADWHKYTIKGAKK